MKLGGSMAQSLERQVLRQGRPEDYEMVLKLNEESVHFLSPMDELRLQSILGSTELFHVVTIKGQVAAFVIALREGQSYDSVNYQWFENHLDHFLYIDRVVVSQEYAGLGLGSLLYDFIFSYAEETHVPQITAEIDIEPANPKSLKFHEKFGFKEIGKQTILGGKKQVSLQCAKL